MICTCQAMSRKTSAYRKPPRNLRTRLRQYKAVIFSKLANDQGERMIFHCIGVGIEG